MLSLYCDNFSIIIYSFVTFFPNLAYDSVLIHIKSAVIFKSNKICKALWETSVKHSHTAGSVNCVSCQCLLSF